MMMTNAEKIQEWRNTHPGVRVTVATLLAVLRLDTLWHADLRNADLRNANLWHADLRNADLRNANLWHADLQDADLRYANLRNANLRNADLRYANLQDADLRNADLRNANLQDANLQDANLQDANLRYANLLNRNSGCILQIVGLYEYATCLTPTPGGWQLRVGCWHGTPATLRDLAAQDDGWPEAIGEEILRRRPLLYTIADMCDAHIANHQGLIEQLAKKWGNRE